MMCSLRSQAAGRMVQQQCLKLLDAACTRLWSSQVTAIQQCRLCLSTWICSVGLQDIPV
jgi:hypothetical protein